MTLALLIILFLTKDGFAFSQEEGGSVSQAELVRAYNTNIPKPEGN